MTRSKALLSLAAALIALPAGELRPRYEPGQSFTSETELHFRMELIGREMGPDDALEPVEIPLGRYMEEEFRVRETDRLVRVADGRVDALEREVETARFSLLNATRPDPEGMAGLSPLHGLRLSTERKTGSVDSALRTRVLEGEPPAGMGWLSGVRLTQEFEALLPESEADAGDAWPASETDLVALLRLDWLASLFDGGGPGRSVPKEGIDRAPRFVVGGVMRTLLLRGSWDADVRLARLDADEAVLEVRATGGGELSRESRASAQEEARHFGQAAGSRIENLSEFQGELSGTLRFDRALGRFVEVEAEGEIIRIHTTRDRREGGVNVIRTLTQVDLELKWSGGPAASEEPAASEDEAR